MLNEISAFLDLLAVPERPILIFEQDQIAVGRRPSVSARFLQQHESEEPENLRIREKFEQ
jgi:hypothetical protein